MQLTSARECSSFAPKYGRYETASWTTVAVPTAERLAFAGLRVLLMTCDT